MHRLLRAVFAKLIRAGTLRVTTADGSSFTLGDGTGKPAAIRFTTRAAERATLVDPALRFGEAYMAALWSSRARSPKSLRSC